MMMNKIINLTEINLTKLSLFIFLITLQIKKVLVLNIMTSRKITINKMWKIKNIGCKKEDKISKILFLKFNF